MLVATSLDCGVCLEFIGLFPFLKERLYLGKCVSAIQPDLRALMMFLNGLFVISVQKYLRGLKLGYIYISVFISVIKINYSQLNLIPTVLLVKPK